MQVHKAEYTDLCTKIEVEVKHQNWKKYVAWRTYTSVQISEGEWKVELVNEDDEVLASTEFRVTGAG